MTAISAEDLQKYHELRKSTQIDYEKVVSIFCPALQAEIVFNSEGFHHLRYDGNSSERDKRVQMTKFRFLNKGIETLKKSTTIQEYRRGLCQVGKPDKSGMRKTKLVQFFAFWAIISFTKKIRIRVIVRRVGEDGNYHFWSVMPFWTIANSQKIIGSKNIEDE